MTSVNPVWVGVINPLYTLKETSFTLSSALWVRAEPVNPISSLVSSSLATLPMDNPDGRLVAVKSETAKDCPASVPYCKVRVWLAVIEPSLAEASFKMAIPAVKYGSGSLKLILKVLEYTLSATVPVILLFGIMT